ncbi:MAG: preprotein translocase subunit YajC [Elusimicrobia bacterium]|nr:preprotein translocase subunit YajC [Elusimicrobiota bacterium]
MQQTSPVMNLVPLIAIFAIFYFLLIRPQQKQAKEHEKMLGALQKGNRVLTSGGLYGTITAIQGQKLEIEIAKSIRVTMARSAVTRVLNENEENLSPTSS